jgi:hypothetical protein
MPWFVWVIAAGVGVLAGLGWITLDRMGRSLREP